jgi:hypothetical protein
MKIRKITECTRVSVPQMRERGHVCTYQCIRSILLLFLCFSEWNLNLMVVFMFCFYFIPIGTKRGWQHYVITFVSDLRKVGGFLRVLRFPQPIKQTATIEMKYIVWLKVLLNTMNSAQPYS